MLDALYRQLVDAPAFQVYRASPPKKPGIYVFSCSESGKYRYVGRTGNLRQRLTQHRSSSPKQATLAAKMARIETERPVTHENKYRYVGRTGSGVEHLIENCRDFKMAFEEARLRIRAMQVRWVLVAESEDDGVQQARLELHAAVELRTLIKDGGYNSFRNH